MKSANNWDQISQSQSIALYADSTGDAALTNEHSGSMWRESYDAAIYILNGTVYGISGGSGEYSEPPKAA